MALLVHRYDPPERFVAGTVGVPGQRTFFLQARDGARVTSVALEKQQVSVLAERLDELLDELMNGSATTLIPAVAPHDLVDNDPLEQPIETEFRAGTMTLAWEPATERVVIEVFPITEAAIVTPEEFEAEAAGVEFPEPEPEEVLLVRLTPGAARAFVQRAEVVVEAGRPDCPFCNQPIDPEGHLCVRANGFKRRLR